MKLGKSYGKNELVHFDLNCKKKCYYIQATKLIFLINVNLDLNY